MSIVHASEFSLKRAHRALGKAFEEEDWDAVKRCDTELVGFLNQAFDDESRDTLALVAELENILATYSKMVGVLPEVTRDRLTEAKE